MYARIILNHARDMVAIALRDQDEVTLFFEPADLGSGVQYVHVSTAVGNSESGAALLICQMTLDQFTVWRTEERLNNVSLFEGRIDLVS